MKIFAVMLLMIVSTTLLKAQTMVVETADGVESFEVGEVEGMSAFKKEYLNLKIEYKNLPIVLTNGEELNFNLVYVIFRPNEPNYNWSYSKLANDTIINVAVLALQFPFVFIEDNSNNALGSAEFLIEISGNQFKRFECKGAGSVGGCWNSSLHRSECILIQQIFLSLNNVPFTINSESKILSAVKGEDLVKNLTGLIHVEKINHYSSEDKEIGILKVREKDLTDDSQIIITIE